MKIGLDISPIQGPHRMRGIGSVIINFINHIDESDASEHEFVFYMYKEDAPEESALDILKTSKVKPEIRFITPYTPRFNIRKLTKLMTVARKYFIGDVRKHDTQDLDVFIQMDQNTPLPRTRAKKILFAYDIIPYVLESRYLISYQTTRNGGSGVARSLKNHIRRLQYKYTVRSAARKADQVIAISEHTKKDFNSILRIRNKKIKVAPLGAPDKVKHPKNIEIRPYRDTSWGALQGNPIDLEKDSYILYVGGIDARRQLLDLFASYNNLKARGVEIKLVLAGDILKGINNIPELKMRKYVTRNSYTDDIIFLGFVTEQEKAWLYEHALSVVYPSVYEGFGLPVLEAMKYGTPVITYRNSSIKEVGGDAALYANNEQEIVNYLLKLNDDPEWRKTISEKSQQQAKGFSWEKTSKQILDIASS